jgi:hypothetical protein
MPVDLVESRFQGSRHQVRFASVRFASTIRLTAWSNLLGPVPSSKSHRIL